MLALKRILEVAIGPVAIVAIATSRYWLLIPLVYLGLWRIVLSESFRRFDPTKYAP